ncbi:hypothetical protein C7B61_12000 [filamentous cyanobacterium CCP1]|nr:hypothetical protein C7B76_16630 [filamentous cyanobacterium CCP2]PSB64636.1 hypothetical protein C7B61_12000 [filamentous cyanobacterium CCP1]
MVTKVISVLGILFVILLGVLGIIQAKSNAEVMQVWHILKTEAPFGERFSPEMIANQPEPVQRYFLHAIAPGTPIAGSVHLKMQGSFRLAPDKDWIPMQAEEILATRGFVWKATAGQGIMQMRGADYYTRGDGQMRFSLWGLIPVVTAHNPDVTRSAIGRWIGEYFWLPSALLPQQGVSWKAIDDHTIQASLKADGEAITLTYVIDQQGKLLRSSFDRWGNQTEDGHYTKIPFGGEYPAEQTFGGYTIPSQVNAGWRIGTDRYFEFFRMTVKQATFQ